MVSLLCSSAIVISAFSFICSVNHSVPYFVMHRSDWSQAHANLISSFGTRKLKQSHNLKTSKKYVCVGIGIGISVGIGIGIGIGVGIGVGIGIGIGVFPFICYTASTNARVC